MKPTFEACLKNAKKYANANEWRFATDSTYGFAMRMKWYKQIVEILGWRTTNQRTYVECLDIAKKYTFLTEWLRGDEASYRYAFRRKWHKKIAKELEWEIKGRGRVVRK